VSGFLPVRRSGFVGLVMEGSVLPEPLLPLPHCGSPAEASSMNAPSASEGKSSPPRFRTKVRHSRGKPILFVPPVEDQPARPTSLPRGRLPDGSEWVSRFVKVACIEGPQE
jgi:hypothetical protein